MLSENVQSRLKQLSSYEYQVKTLSRSIKEFTVELEAFLELNTVDDDELINFLDILDVTLKNQEYLGKQKLSIEKIKGKLVGIFPDSSCQDPPCRQTGREPIEKVVDSFANVYRSQN